jgi:hypothetical protein
MDRRAATFTPRSLTTAIALLAVLLVRPALAADKAGAAPSGKGQTSVLIVAGHPGNELYARHYRDRIARFAKYFVGQAHVAPTNITVLSGDAANKDALLSGPATAQRILAAVAELAQKLKPEDQFILVLLGHGATSDDNCTLMLPGPDIDYAALAEAVNRIPAGNQVVLNFTSNSGDTIAHLSRMGRAVVTAGVAGQVNDSDFAEFFLQALETGAPDTGAEAKQPAKAGPLSLLAAYNWAALHMAQWIVRQKMSDDPDTPGWTVEGKQSAEIFKKLYSGSDVPASRAFLASPASDQPDGPVELVCNSDASWLGRRLVTETPALEDLGQGKGKAEAKGLTAVGDKGYQPLRGKSPTDVGFLARHVVLGNAQLLTPEPEADAALPADHPKEKAAVKEKPADKKSKPAPPKKAKSTPKKAKTPPPQPEKETK